MGLIFKLLPILLIVAVLYVLMYNLIPTFKTTINLANELKKLEAEKKSLKVAEEFVNSLSAKIPIQSTNIQEFQKSLLKFLPADPLEEELIYQLYVYHKDFGYKFSGLSIGKGGEKSLNDQILPVKTLTFSLSLKDDLDKIVKFISTLEENVRILSIKNFNVDRNGNASFNVEAYFMPLAY
ncbi:MAG: hypothetical protein KatS3mg097_471 [Candidatus Parcubacteria bacterium]|nr:MAG: hypothetical protein KatS3mg097_471 [Candidatus Parcubacteria bacterium]